MGNLLVGFDLGQGGLKATALEPNGRIVASTTASYPTSRKQPGWAEQDPADWLAALSTASHHLLERCNGGRVVGIGLTSATHHAVLLGAGDSPLRPCILLSDGRSADHASRLSGTHGELIHGRSRNQPSAGWTLPQLQWVADHEPSAWKAVQRISLAKDFVTWNLTGEWASDWIDAEGTLLARSATHSWDPELCALAGLAPAALNPIVAPTAIVGHVTRAGSELTGLPVGIPVVAGASDTAAEMLAAGATQPGDVVVKLATAGVVGIVTESATPRPGWFTYTYLTEGLDYQALGTNTAAEAYRWFSELFPDTGLDQLDEEAGRVPPGSGGVMFHPFLMGERSPYFDPDLRATFLGLGSDHGRGHLARAVMEGVSLSLLDNLLIMQEHLTVGSSARVVGGGSSSSLWRSILADALGLNLTLPTLSDASAGAALIAGVGVGEIDGFRDAGQWATPVDRVAANPTRHAGYRELLEVYRTTRKRLADVGPRLRSIKFT